MKFRFTTLLILTFFLAGAQVYDDYVGAGQAIDVTVTSSDADAEGTKSVDGAGLDLDLQGASRFLAAATMGADIDQIRAVEEMGFEAWIDGQMQIPSSPYTQTTISILFDEYDRCMEIFPDSCEFFFNINTRHWRYALWHHMMTSDDLLRQKVALALSEILVISDQSELGNRPHAIANYFQMLSANAFGNYRDLLTQVTMHLSMGFYLSHLNNPLTIESLNIHPDENYAREIMQLFSIGLYMLNIDGSRQTDLETGLWIPTYDNNDIKGLAKVFTGLSGGAWADPDNVFPVEFGQSHYAYSPLVPMQMFEQWHEKGEKTILDGFTIPDGQTGMQDIQMALDHLFNHPNVGPFLAVRLIQRLVKSNPSPAYIQRVAEVFNDNGSGVRGDLGAMVKAILLDVEALDCYWKDDEFNGMLREPVMRVTQLLRGLKAETESEWFWNSGFLLQAYTEQFPLASPTVFNFFTPDYVPNSEFAYNELEGPEFQILNSATSSNYVNFMLIGIMREYLNDRFNIDLPNILNENYLIPYLADQAPYSAELADQLWLELSFTPEELVDYLDLVLANGHLSEETKEQIATSATLFQNPLNAAYYAAFLTMISPDYVIKK